MRYDPEVPPEMWADQFLICCGCGLEVPSPVEVVDATRGWCADCCPGIEGGVDDAPPPPDTGARNTYMAADVGHGRGDQAIPVNAPATITLTSCTGNNHLTWVMVTYDPAIAQFETMIGDAERLAREYGAATADVVHTEDRYELRLRTRSGMPESGTFDVDPHYACPSCGHTESAPFRCTCDVQEDALYALRRWRFRSRPDLLEDGSCAP